MTTHATEITGFMLTDNVADETFTWHRGDGQDAIEEWLLAQYPGLDGIETAARELAHALVRNDSAIARHRTGWADMSGHSSEGLGALDWLDLRHETITD